MSTRVVVDANLIRKHGSKAVSYASYPTARHFARFEPAAYRKGLSSRNVGGLVRPLALYVHLPGRSTLADEEARRPAGFACAEQAAAYLSRLSREVELVAQTVSNGPLVRQVRIGTHWPGALTDEQLHGLLSVIDNAFQLRSSSDCEIDVDPLAADPSEMGSLRDIGFDRIYLRAPGKAVQSGEVMERAANLVAAARKYGCKSVAVHVTLPREAREGHAANDALAAVIAAQPERIALDMREILRAPDSNLELLDRTLHRLHAAGYLHIGLGRFAKPGDELALAQARSQLMYDLRGYTVGAEYDVIGLGVGAMGQIAGSYVQNAGSLDAYLAALEQGRLPVAHGWQLSPDDLVRRGVMRSLICHFETCMESIAIAYLVDFKDYFRTELGTLESYAREGIVDLDHEWISVTPRGRLLVESVCAVFDPHRSPSSLA